jgi:hypothetical protein
VRRHALLQLVLPGSERLSRSCPSARGSGNVFDAVPETPKFANHLGRPALGACFGHGWPTFFVRNAVVQNLPHEPTEAVRNGADRLLVSEPVIGLGLGEMERA